MAGYGSRVLLVVFLLLQAAWGLPAENSFFASRREVLMKKIAGSLILLQGASAMRSYDGFRQGNNFYYLTGVEVPDAFVLLDANRHRSILFLPSRSKAQETWEGARLVPGEDARRRTGFDDVLDVDRLSEELDKRRKGIGSLFIPMQPEEYAATSRDRALAYEKAREQSLWDGRVSRERALADNLKKKLGSGMAVRDLSPILDEMRRVKDALEIERLRESARIGALGLAAAMRSARSGAYEYQLAASAEFFFKWSGAMGYAYSPIVGSGPNSCVIHYERNDRKTEAGDIVVMDFGSDYRYYHSDITRTFPISGKFSEEQAVIYRIVLEAQQAALKKVRPGASLGEIGNAARDVVARHGYLGGWLHGVSHYVGMSTHDVGEIRPLEPGVVLTVEPGLYFPAKNLGVRIEDTVLVTMDGCEVLSNQVPKEIDQIEKLMSEKGPALPLSGELSHSNDRADPGKQHSSRRAESPAP